MNNRKAGWLALSVIAFHIVAVVVLKMIIKNMDDLPISLSLLFGELIIAIPAVIFLITACLGSGESPAKVLGFHKIKVTTAFLMIALGLSIIPLATFLNLFSMLFTKSVVTESAAEVLSYPMYLVILCGGIIGPLVEESACRGLIFSGMKKEMSAIFAIILSAFVFGLFHMNLNQFLYAFAIGIFLALAVEATGSVWASFIVHMTINTQQSLKMMLVNKLLPDIYSSSLASEITNQQLLISAGVYLVLGGVFTCVGIGILVLAANLEGRLGALKTLTADPNAIKISDGTETSDKASFKDTLTLPYIAATILAIAFIIVYEIMTRSA
ncbi:MAG: CPBP family intramembrane metalloprotease [Lachnospiraceae bacterium]|nr:CPBP family intramembrane metalloprotease [Lachnospiraceae bacterium]